MGGTGEVEEWGPWASGLREGGTRRGANEDKRLCQNPIRDAFSAVEATRCVDFTAAERSGGEMEATGRKEGQHRIWAPDTPFLA